jgi:hypothetical protein
MTLLKFSLARVLRCSESSIHWHRSRRNSQNVTFWRGTATIETDENVRDLSFANGKSFAISP